MKLKQLLTLSILLSCGPVAGSPVAGGPVAAGSLFVGTGVFVSTGDQTKSVGYNRSGAKSYFFTMDTTPASTNGSTDEDEQTIESKLLFHINPAGFIREARVQSGNVEQKNGEGFAEVNIISQSSDHIEYSVAIGGDSESEEDITLFGKSKGFLRIEKESGSGSSAKYKIQMGLRPKKIADDGTDYFIVADADAKYGFDIVEDITDKRVIDVISITTNQTFSLVEEDTATLDTSTAYTDIAKSTLTASSINFPIYPEVTTYVKEGVADENGLITFNNVTSGNSFDKIESDLQLLFPLRFNTNILDDNENVNKIQMHDEHSTQIDLNHARFENGILEVESGNFLELVDETSQETLTKIYAVKKDSSTLFVQIFIVPKADTASLKADSNKRFGYEVGEATTIGTGGIKMLQISTELYITGT